MRQLGLVPCFVIVLVGALACDGQRPSDASKSDESPKAEAKTPDAPEPDADPGRDHEEANFAQPNLAPPPAPEGSVTIEGPWLYVQTCAEPHPCPELKQPAGDAHCRELELDGHGDWRLPDKDEVVRFEGVAGLENTAGYHWTRTPFGDDVSQVWIVDPDDPQNAPATTIPRDRKPFRIRCVQEP